MTIAIVYATFYTRGGSESIILWLTEELLKRGHQVTIFTSEYHKDDPAIPESVRRCFVELYAAGGNYSTWIDWLLTGIRLRKQLQQFDIVNPHNFPANVWVYFAKCLSRTFPHIVWFCQEPSRTLYEAGQHVQQGHYQAFTIHLREKFRREGFRIVFKIIQKGLFYTINRVFRRPLRRVHIWLDQRAARTCDLVLANSRYMASKIEKTYHRTVISCHLGVPLGNIQPSDVSEKKVYFLTVSRLEPLKHVDTIIQAVNILVHEQGRTDVSLVIIGTGTQKEILKKLVKQLDLQNHITLSGYVTDDELHRRYREALAVIYVPEDEPFGLVPVEAMLHNTAVIVSQDGGTAETVKNQVTGIHVEPGNIEQLADAMTRLLENRHLAVDMGQKGGQHVMQHFTFAHFVDRFEQHLKRIRTQRV